MSLQLPLLPSTMSRFMRVFFVFTFSIGVLLLLEFPPTTSDQIPWSNYLLLSTASLNFFLATIMLPLLLTMSAYPIHALLIDHFAMAAVMGSFTALVFSFPNLNKPSQLEVGRQPGLICFATAMLYKLIRTTFTNYHNQSLRVAFLALCIAIAGLYADDLFYLPGSVPYNSIIYQTKYFYRFALIPLTFFMGAILIIFGVLPPTNQLLPFASDTFREGLTTSTVALATTTMVIGVSLMIYVALANLAMARGFRIGGMEEI